MKNNPITLQDLSEAWADFTKRPKSSDEVIDFEYNLSRELRSLYKDLISETYSPGKSIAFCVTRPKLREVFAANTRDRVVHHLLIGKFLQAFEASFIDNTYNCRIGKGVSAMTTDINQALTKVGDQGWILKVDVKGCFMSIDKDILWGMLEPFIRSWSRSRPEISPWTDWWVNLWRKIIYYRPDLSCEIHGNPKLFDQLPPDKTLFKTNGKGLPIGNLTSQILANFYFNPLDHAAQAILRGDPSGYYGRYMDDIVLIGESKETLLEALRSIKSHLKELGMKLGPKKFYLQRATKSVKIIGYVHKSGRVYPGTRTIAGALRTIERFYRKSQRLPPTWILFNLPKFVSSMNSYYGFIRFAKNSYNIRRTMWSYIPPRIRQFLTHDKNFRKIKIPKFFKYPQIKRLMGIRFCYDMMCMGTIPRRMKLKECPSLPEFEKQYRGDPVRYQEGLKLTWYYSVEYQDRLRAPDTLIYRDVTDDPGCAAESSCQDPSVPID